MPLVWAGGIVTRARKENRIKDDFALKTLIDELNIFRGGCGGMLNYDWISIPLVYTQVGSFLCYLLSLFWHLTWHTPFDATDLKFETS